MILLRLFYEFFIIGLFSFGGGLATIPFLQELSARTGWFTLRELMDMIAIAEATPGPIGVNMATYAGFTTAGVPGGIIATLGLVVPSIIIASTVARLLDRFKESSLVKSAFYGLRPASLGLVAFAGVSVLRLSLIRADMLESGGMSPEMFDLRAVILAAILFVLTNKVKLHPIIFLAAAAVVGIIFRF